MAVAMAALDAQVETVSADGQTRAIPLTDFHTPPGEHPEVETVLGRASCHRRRPAAAARRWPGLPQGRDRASYAFA
jgi:xanthine dehydrogenase YagS FAD-binding subunit